LFHVIIATKLSKENQARLAIRYFVAENVLTNIKKKLGGDLTQKLVLQNYVKIVE